MSAEVISSQANRTKTWLLKLHRYPKRKSWNTEKPKTYKCLIFSQWSGVVRNDLGQKICNLVGVTETVTRKVDRHRDRQTDRQADRPRDRQTDQLTGRQTDRQPDRETSRQTDWQADRKTDWQADRQTDKQTKRLTYRQTGRQTDKDCSINRYLQRFLIICYFYIFICDKKSGDMTRDFGRLDLKFGQHDSGFPGIMFHFPHVLLDYFWEEWIHVSWDEEMKTTENSPNSIWPGSKPSSLTLRQERSSSVGK